LTLAEDGSFLTTYGLPKTRQAGGPDGRSDGRIVEAFKYHRKIMTLGSWMDIARAIEAEIGAVRKLFRNHEKRINEGQIQGENFRKLFTSQFSRFERKVKGLEKRLESYMKEECPYKVDKLKPQPAKPQAPDKDGAMHDLIPGVSVIQGPYLEMLFLRQNSYGNFVGYTSDQRAGRNKDGTWISHPGHCTWVRNLDLPATGTGRGK
jgi:hypothetical protein